MATLRSVKGFISKEAFWKRYDYRSDVPEQVLIAGVLCNTHQVLDGRVDCAPTLGGVDKQPAGIVIPADNAENAAVTTLGLLGYTYSEGAALWKPPIGYSPFLSTDAQVAHIQERMNDSITLWRDAFNRMHRRAMRAEVGVIVVGGDSI